MKNTLVSLIIAAYNEESVISESLNQIDEYIKKLSNYDWELVIVDDGSKDNTPALIDDFARGKKYVKVIHHIVNLNLGNALQTGFNNSTGNYVLTFDIDLSYSLDHIEKMLTTIEQTQADVLLASAYMKGGKVTAVPFTRRVLSRFVNFIMSIAAQEKFHTFTCMVRAYKGDFIRSLNLKTKDYEINPEIIYKSLILRARIVEIPAHLDWSFQKKKKAGRTSKVRIFKGVVSGLMSSFIFRPYLYFFGVGTLILFLSLYIFAWIFLNVARIYRTIEVSTNFIDDRFSAAVSQLFNAKPYTFLIGGFTLVIALQFLSAGFLSLQKKRYFEELFHISTSLKKQLNK